MAEKTISLRDALRRDFGFDVPLIGGNGSVELPYLLSAANPTSAGRAAIEILSGYWRGRARVRGVELFWRVLAIDVVEGTCRVRLEQKTFLPDRIETDVLGVRFQADRCGPEAWEAPTISHDGSPLRLPFKLSWLECHQAPTYENTTPGLGFGFGFFAPGIKLDVYLYSGDRLATPESAPYDLVQREIDDVLAVATRQNCVRELEISKPPLFFTDSGQAVTFYNEKEYHLFVAIDRRIGFFLKIRGTFIPDERDAIVKDAMTCLGEEIHKQLPVNVIDHG